MQKIQILYLLFFYSASLFALECPDPQTSSLKNGQLPSPWVLPNYSHSPSPGTSVFIQAYLFTGSSPGVLCSYSHPLGNYSIFWSTPIQTPISAQWMFSLDGYFCVQSISSCSFTV